MFETVTAPFAQATARLKKSADGRVLDYWILQIGQHFVERILEVIRESAKSTSTSRTSLLGIQTFDDQDHSFERECVPLSRSTVSGGPASHSRSAEESAQRTASFVSLSLSLSLLIRSRLGLLQHGSTGISFPRCLLRERTERLDRSETGLPILASEGSRESTTLHSRHDSHD